MLRIEAKHRITLQIAENLPTLLSCYLNSFVKSIDIFRNRINIHLNPRYSSSGRKAARAAASSLFPNMPDICHRFVT